MNNFFSYDNVFFQAMNQVMDALCISFLWILFSLPVFTISASTAACYYTVHHVMLGERGYVFRTFWGAFRSSFRQVTWLWIGQLCCLAVLSVDRWYCGTHIGEGAVYVIGRYLFLILILFVIVWAIYAAAYAARFEADSRTVLRNSALLTIGHLPWSLLIMVLLVAAVVLGRLLMFTVLAVLLLLFPVTLCLLYHAILERIFRSHMSPEDLKREEESFF